MCSVWATVYRKQQGERKRKRLEKQEHGDFEEGSRNRKIGKENGGNWGKHGF